MKSGRFFKSSDFTPTNKVCVIGKDLEKKPRKKMEIYTIHTKEQNIKFLE